MGLKHLMVAFLPQPVQHWLRDYRRRRHSLKTYNPNLIKSPVFESSIAVLDYHKCIFVHIPKNAGLSICYALFGNTAGSHRKIKDYKKIFAPATFKRYYKFTFVRNPWDRLVSTFFFLKKGGLTTKDALWAQRHLAGYSDFGNFVKSWLTAENIHNSLHFQPQYVFLEDAHGHIAMDFIGRFENMENDFNIVASKLNIATTLKKTNSSGRKKDYRCYYDGETEKIVRQVYKKDIELFGYEF